MIQHVVVGNDGLSTCTTAGYDGMASLRSSEESDLLISVAGAETGSMWIGHTDASSEEIGSWTDGSANDYINWEPNQPSNNNASPDYDCAVLLNENNVNDSMWYDFDCAESRRLTCSYRQ